MDLTPRDRLPTALRLYALGLMPAGTKAPLRSFGELGWGGEPLTVWVLAAR